MRTPLRHLTLLLALIAGAGQAADYRVDTLVRGLDHPWSLAFLPDGRMLVTERVGRLRMIDAEGELVEEPLAGLPEVFSSGQAGLKEVALAPDFAESSLLYLSYACGSSNANHLCLARARLEGHALNDVEEIFRAQPAKRGGAHYGGRIAFLPDGTLLLPVGDGFDYREESQKLSSHLGSIVRLNPDGSVPGDNPFVDQDGALPEIYSLGHRNPQGIVYDEQEGRVVSTEHGPRGGDEVNVIQPGANYGWPLVTHGVDYTGARITPYSSKEGYEDPLVDWTPSIAPAGLALYRGDLFADWDGDYLVPALAGQAVHRVRFDNQGASDVETLFSGMQRRFRDVRVGPDGALYLLTDRRHGEILRVTPENMAAQSTEKE